MNTPQKMQELQTIEKAWLTLLPLGCYMSCGEIDRNYPSLTDIERASFTKTLSFIRLAEIKAGRYHAKNALAKANIIASDLPKSKDNHAPHWPSNVKGSITHTANTDILSHVAAVVTTAIQIKHIGIDAEYFTALRPDMWGTFMSKDELEWVLTINTELRTSLAKKIWCLKEAAIKAHFQANIMAFSVYPDTNTSFTEFNLVNHGSQNSPVKGRAVEVNGLTLALVYT